MRYHMASAKSPGAENGFAAHQEERSRIVLITGTVKRPTARQPGARGFVPDREEPSVVFRYDDPIVERISQTSSVWSSTLK